MINTNQRSVLNSMWATKMKPGSRLQNYFKGEVPVMILTEILVRAK